MSTLSSIDPTSVDVSDGTLTLHVLGSGFTANAVVEVDSVPLPTTYVWSGQLDGTLDAASLTSAAAQVVVRDGADVSNALTLTVTGIVAPPTVPKVRPLIVPADALALVLKLLREHTLLADVADRIMLVSPKDTSQPWVRITLIGGSSTLAPVLDVATLDVAAFAPPSVPDSHRVAHELARRCEAVLRQAVGYSTADASINRVETVTGISYQPDESRTPPTARWVFTTYVHVRTQTKEAA